MDTGAAVNGARLKEFKELPISTQQLLRESNVRVVSACETTMGSKGRISFPVALPRKGGGFQDNVVEMKDVEIMSHLNFPFIIGIRQCELWGFVIDCKERRVFHRNEKGELVELPLYTNTADKDTRQPVSVAPVTQTLTMSGFVEESKDEGSVPPPHPLSQQVWSPGNKAKRKAARRERWLTTFHATHSDADWRDETLRMAALLTLSAWQGEGKPGFPPIPTENELDTLMSVVCGLGVKEEKTEIEKTEIEIQTSVTENLPRLLSESDTESDSDEDEDLNTHTHLSSLKKTQQA